MRNAVVVCVCCVAITAAVAAKQGTSSTQAGQAGATSTPQTQGRGGPPPTLVAEVQTMFNNIKRFVTAAAGQSPEDKYGWSPTPDVRTWAALLGHIADDNNGSCFTLSGETERPARFDQNGKLSEAAANFKKADIVRVLSESF